MVILRLDFSLPVISMGQRIVLVEFHSQIITPSPAKMESIWTLLPYTPLYWKSFRKSSLGGLSKKFIQKIRQTCNQ